MDFKKCEKFLKDERGIMQLIMLAVALLIIFVVIQILPVVNSSIAASITLPAAGAAGSEWNSTANTALVNASSMWVSVGGIFKVTLIVAIIAVLLAYLFSVVPKGASPPGGGL